MRLRAQGLADVAPGTSPAAAVRSVLALQAQDARGATWSIGVRAPGSSSADVAAAFDTGLVVRSWPLRGTLHAVAAQDLGWLLDLTAPRVIASAARRRAVLEITDADLGRAAEVASHALEGRRVLDRSAMLAALAAGGVAVDGQRGYHLLWHLALCGILVLGPSHGTAQAFALLGEWAPSQRRLERDEALGELVARYVLGHGPVLEADIARWAGITLGDVRRGIAVAGGAVGTLMLGGIRHLVAAGAADLPGVAPSTLLLAGFDEYLLGYADRSAALAPEHAERVVPGSNGMFKATVVVDGDVVGTWGATIRTRDVAVAVEPFPGVGPERLAGVTDAAARYARFLGRTLGR